MDGMLIDGHRRMRKVRALTSVLLISAPFLPSAHAVDYLQCEAMNRARTEAFVGSSAFRREYEQLGFKLRADYFGKRSNSWIDREALSQVMQRTLSGTASPELLEAWRKSQKIVGDMKKAGCPQVD